MFFKKKKQNCAGAAVYIGSLGNVRLVETDSEAHKFFQAVEKGVEQRLAEKKQQDEFNAAPKYKVTSSYNLEKNEDSWHLQAKERHPHYGGSAVYYRNIFTSVTKAEVDARFKRLTAELKKAA